MTEQAIEIPFTNKQKTIACIISQYMLEYTDFELCKSHTDAVGTYIAIKYTLEYCLDKLEGPEDEFKKWIEEMIAAYIDYVTIIRQSDKDREQKSATSSSNQNRCESRPKELTFGDFVSQKEKTQGQRRNGKKKKNGKKKQNN